MKRNLKKWIACVLAALMLMSSVPFSAFAADAKLVALNNAIIDGVNDSERDLKRICELLNDYSIPIKFPNKNSVWIDCIHKNIPNLKIIV